MYNLIYFEFNLNKETNGRNILKCLELAYLDSINKMNNLNIRKIFACENNDYNMIFDCQYILDDDHKISSLNFTLPYIKKTNEFLMMVQRLKLNIKKYIDNTGFYIQWMYNHSNKWLKNEIYITKSKQKKYLSKIQVNSFNAFISEFKKLISIFKKDQDDKFYETNKFVFDLNNNYNDLLTFYNHLDSSMNKHCYNITFDRELKEKNHFSSELGIIITNKGEKYINNYYVYIICDTLFIFKEYMNLKRNSFKSDIVDICKIHNIFTTFYHNNENISSLESICFSFNVN